MGAEPTGGGAAIGARRAVFALAVLASVGAATGLSVAQDMDECLISPWKTIKLGARSTGVLESIEIDRGQVVALDQIVAHLNSEIEQASVELAKARAEDDTQIELAAAREEFEEVASQRKEELFKRKVISSSEIDEARATRKIAALQVEQARDDKRMAGLEYQRALALAELKTVRSPVGGLVVSTDRAEGEYVDQGDHVATIATIDPLRVEAYLPLDRLPVLHEGADVTVYPQEPVGGSLAGVIDVVDRVVDARSGTIGIRVRVDNPGHLTLAGLRCRIDLAPK